MVLTGGVLAFLLEYLDQWVKVLVELYSHDLNETLKRKKNEVLAFLLEHPDQLVKMLVEIQSGGSHKSLNLRFLLTDGKNGILAFLLKALTSWFRCSLSSGVMI
jgi:hypothetical protein